MPESFKTERYEDRPSSKLGAIDYMTKHVPWMLLPLIGLGVGFGLRKLTHIPLLEAEYNPAKWFVKKAMNAESAAMLDAASTGGMRNAEAWGLKIASAVGLYHLWGTNTKTQLEIDQLTTDITALRAMESPNDHLKQENEQLREQIAFRDKHTVSARSHEGRVSPQVEVASER